MARRLKKKVKKALIAAAALLAVVIVAIIVIVNINPIKLTAETADIPVFSTVDFKTYLKENKINDEIVINADEVKLDTLGTYTVSYQYKKKTKELTVNVKDVTAPTIDDKAIKVIVNKEVDLKQKIKYSDDYDQNPTVTIDDSKLDMSKKGTYEITATVTDASNNSSSQVINVKVGDTDVTKVVYLTFDDGPSSVTESVLDTLKKYNVKATFFVTGINGSGGVESKYADLTKRAYEEGHTIALHSYTHDYKTIYQSNEAFLNDLTTLSDKLYDLIGVRPTYFRFPGGSNNGVYDNYGGNISSMKSLIEFMESKGYKYFDWNADSTDASGNNVEVSKIVSNSKSTKVNVNLLMHDTGAKATTAKALPSIIEYYLANDYEFRGIDEDFIPHF